MSSDKFGNGKKLAEDAEKSFKEPSKIADKLKTMINKNMKKAVP